MRMITCNECGAYKPHASKGRCRTCHSRQSSKRRARRACVQCGSVRLIKGHGQCGDCYLGVTGFSAARPEPPPEETWGPHGLPLSTLAPTASEMERERARRVEVYAAHVAAGGEIRYGEGLHGVPESCPARG